MSSKDARIIWQKIKIFISQFGICLQISPPYDCKRVCEDIQLGGGNKIGEAGDGKQRNVVLVSGVFKRVFTASNHLKHYLI